MNFAVLAAVAAGGAIGSTARYMIAGWVQSAAWEGFPYGIFVVNISGGLIMGLLTELMALKWSVSLEVRAFLTTGILGGYTTFSTFSLDSALLIQRGAYTSAGGLYRRIGHSLGLGSVCGALDRSRSLCLNCAPSPTMMTAFAWTAGSSGIIRRSPMRGWKNFCGRARCGLTASAPRQPTASPRAKACACRRK